ncbi:AAA family ATPase [Lysobacter sp. H23M47]|uniref:AAA family ATPase n=1 Tax=Lysobacter sp. H23M47 TaxID=2781024 RepID=UPI0018808826|nr:AAA family ATPase [Lysobacter sp. H23M47]QOW23597.1 AAA family ATPase [Lysobacter sp. H23M47]
MASKPVSRECSDVLALLTAAKNVLISGPPGTGKTKLLAEVHEAFLGAPGAPAKVAVHEPGSRVAIPAIAKTYAPYADNLPSPSKTKRQVFRTVFHQNSKYRDFVSGIAPAVGAGVAPGTFKVVEGTLYRASEHAKLPDGASLLIIDEINRGPAVQIFGGALVAIEADKRLASDGNAGPETQFFEVLTSPNGEIVEYALPDHLYILAVQNQADTSVEPLDVAFLRRWEPYRLDPNSSVLRSHYGLPALTGAALPESPTSPADIYEASVRAWEAVNQRVSLGRGAEFRVGHGVLMRDKNTATTIEAAQLVVANSWARVIAHIEEVFFGDVRGVAATINSIDAPAYHPVRLQEQTFADDLRYELTGLSSIGPANIYDLLRAIVG